MSSAGTGGRRHQASQAPLGAGRPLTSGRGTQPSVADVVGATIAAQDVGDAFGVLGSGNLVVTNALCTHGARFHHARHEGAAVCMADGYARVSGRVGVCSVHQGPGLTNTITGLAEAAKSRTPVLVLAGETPASARTSNFRIDQRDLVESVGAIADRVHGPSTAADDNPRTLSIALDDALPKHRAVAVDSGHFLGYPCMYLDVPDAYAWVFANGFQSAGLGLGNAIGAAIANPDRPTVAAVGDGGAFMSLAELETAARLHLGNLLVVIYDDATYGAEVHRFAPLGHDVSLVRFRDADLATIAESAGAKARTVRSTDDLGVVAEWLAEHRGHPLVLDAKVNPTVCAEWLEEAFRAG